jgi:translation initiation factor 2A
VGATSLGRHPKSEDNHPFCGYPSDNDRATVVDASVGHEITSFNLPNVYELAFSPLGTYISTWQRPSKDEKGDAVKNLNVWKLIEGNCPEENDEHKPVGRFVQKSQSGWGLQYTADEKQCARLVTNEVQIYESEDLGKVWSKLRVEGVSDFQLAPGKLHSIAVYVPERKVRKITGGFDANVSLPLEIGYACDC